MKKVHLVVAVYRGKISYRTPDGGWSTRRSAAVEYPTYLLAQRERDAHWHYDVTHETRTESVRRGL